MKLGLIKKISKLSEGRENFFGKIFVIDLESELSMMIFFEFNPCAPFRQFSVEKRVNKEAIFEIYEKLSKDVFPTILKFSFNIN